MKQEVPILVNVVGRDFRYSKGEKDLSILRLIPVYRYTRRLSYLCNNRQNDLCKKEHLIMEVGRLGLNNLVLRFLKISVWL